MKDPEPTRTLQHAVPIASGYAHRCDPAALVVGPRGLVYDHKTNQLFVGELPWVMFLHIDGKGRSLKGDGSEVVLLRRSTIPTWM